MKFKFYIGLHSVSLAVLVGLAGCKKSSEEKAPSRAALPSLSVRVQKIELIEVPDVEEIVGTVRAKLHATLEAKQSGRIEKLPVLLGDKVRAGDLVARLDSAEAIARFDQARASLEHAERDWKRVAALFEQQSATRAERDTAEAKLLATRGALAEAKASLALAEIVAPFDGVVTKKWADVGDLATPGKPIIDLEDPNGLQVEVDLPESLSAPLSPGAEFAVLAAPDGAVKGVLREVAPAVDPVTRTRNLKLELTNTPQLVSGQFVRVSVPLGQRKAIFVPTEAIVDRGQLQIAFSLENQHARMRLVKTGRSAGGTVEILSGLQAGDSVVVEGAERLSDGQPVEVK